MSAYGSRRRILLSVEGELMLFWSAYVAEQGGIAASSTPGNAVIRLPVIDKQDIQFTRLSVAGESFQNAVVSIAQDHLGFLWFGTENGLYRYDGYKLKAYRHERGNPNSINDDGVCVVLLRPRRQSAEGIATYDAVTSTLRVIR